MTKCQDYNGQNINEGDNIIICINKNSQTEINMPKGKYKYLLRDLLEKNDEDAKRDLASILFNIEKLPNYFWTDTKNEHLFKYWKILGFC